VDCRGHLQLNVFKPLIGANVLRSIELLTIGMDSFATNCVAGLQPDRARIADLLDRSLMLVTALAPIIGYDNDRKKSRKQDASRRNHLARSRIGIRPG